MGKILKTGLLIIAIAAIAGINSCNTNGCLDNQSSIPLAGFYSMSTKKAISIDSLSVFGVGAPGDSSILSSSTASQVYLPLRNSTKVTQYVFHYNQKAISSTALNDTITINYDAFPFFVSSECGAMYNFNVSSFSFTRHVMDSVAIPTMKFTNKNVETIKIFFRTSES